MNLRPHLNRLKAVQQVTFNDMGVNSALARMAQIMSATRANGGTIFAFGNGGSASQADHFVGELLGWFEKKNRKTIRAHSLVGEIASMTAVFNDAGSTNWPLRALEASGPKDCVLFLSTSGRSLNVVAAIEMALSRRADDPVALPMLITGRGWETGSLFDVDRNWMPVAVVDSENTSLVQELTLPMLHALIREIEQED